MKIFTVRTEGTSEKYDAYLDGLRKVYPDLIVVDSENIYSEPYITADYIRIKTLAQNWIYDDILYCDMDCIVECAFDPTMYNRPAFYNLCGGVYDNCVIFKPKGCHTFFGDLLFNEQWKSPKIQKLLNGELFGSVDHIYGYPDYKHFKHEYINNRYRVKSLG